MVPCFMLVAPSPLPSVPLKPIIPSFSSLVSANSALKSPRSHSSQLSQPAEPPNHFPLFPHPVNTAHTETPANPSSSVVYFTLLCIPGGGGPGAPHLPAPVFNTALHIRNPFRRNAYKKLGGGHSCIPVTASEPSARNTAGRSIAVVPFDFKLSIEDPGPVGTVDLFSPIRLPTSRDRRKSLISNTYKKRGGLPKPHAASPGYSLLYPLLTSPIISLHYAFEAHHDS